MFLKVYDGLGCGKCSNEHYQQGYRDAIDEVKHLLGGLEGSIYWYDGLCEKLEKLKDKKND